MFLRNFDNLMIALTGANLNRTEVTSVTKATYTSYTGYNVGSAFEDGRINVRYTNGSIAAPAITISSSDEHVMAPAPALAQAIVFGSGSTSVSYDDYKLSGTALNQYFSLVSQSCVTSFTDNYRKMIKELTVIVANTSEETHTINEWGLCLKKSANSSWTDYSEANNVVLTFREVLASPVVVESGGSTKLTLTIEYPIPNHP